MSTKYRWFVIKRSSKPITRAMMSIDEVDVGNRDTWFEPLEDGANFSFRFFRRSEVALARYRGPNEVNYELVDTVSFVDASLLRVNGNSVLRVENPGRNLQPLMLALERKIGRGFTSKSMMLDGLRPANVLAGVDVAKVVSLKITNAVVGNETVARMEFASREGVVVEKMKFLNGIRFKLDQVKYELIYKGVRGVLLCSSAGAIAVGGELAPRLLNLVQKDLAESGQ